MSEQSAELTNILDRLGKVERENRRLKRMGLAFLVLVGALLLMGQARQSNRTIEAEKFVLKDATGMPRARLEMESADRPTLALLDPKGFPLVSLAAGENPFLSLCRGNCENQVQIALTQDLVGLAFYEGGEGYNPARGDHGNLSGLRAGLGVFKGIPGLSLYNEKATEQTALDLDAYGPKLVLRDPSGALRTTLGMTLGQQTSFLDLSDEQGFRTTIGSTPLEVPRTGETRKTSAASIVLFDKEGKVLWSAP